MREPFIAGASVGDVESNVSATLKTDKQTYESTY
jgi:hypothetical protein